MKTAQVEKYLRNIDSKTIYTFAVAISQLYAGFLCGVGLCMWEVGNHLGYFEAAKAGLLLVVLGVLISAGSLIFIFLPTQPEDFY